MYAATPVLTDFSGSVCGPLVRRWQLGLEQRNPERAARVATSARGKLWRRAMITY